MTQTLALGLTLNSNLNPNLDNRPRSDAASKKGGGGGLKFEAEATAHLQRSGVPVTDDKPKYRQEDVATRLLAILSEGGFVQSTEARAAPPRHHCTIPDIKAPKVHVRGTQLIFVS